MNAANLSLHDLDLYPSSEFSIRRVLVIHDCMNYPSIALESNVREPKVLPNSLEASHGGLKASQETLSAPQEKLKAPQETLSAPQERLRALRDSLMALAAEKNYSAFATAQSGIGMLNLVIENEATMLVLAVEQLVPSILEQLSNINQVAPLTVVVFASKHDDEVFAQLTEAGIDSYNVDGSAASYDSENLDIILEMAEQRFAYQKTLKDELKQIRQKLDDRKLIERAKGILMQQHRLSEDQAYRKMRRSAMNQGTPIADLAARLIEVSESFADV